MGRRAIRAGIVGQLMIALISVLGLLLVSSDAVSAVGLSDYFSFSYTVQLSKSQVTGSELFNAIVTAQATCTRNLPVAASEAFMTGRIVAQHQTTGVRVTLNSSYTVTVNPFPSQVGETAQASVVVPLGFPAGSQPGVYSVVAELIEAKVKALIWIPVTAYLPPSQPVGSITYVSPAGDGGSGGGGGGTEKQKETLPPPSLQSSTTVVSDVVTAAGTFIATVVAKSNDGKIQLTIAEGTKGYGPNSAPLAAITIIGMVGAPAPPGNYTIIGPTYDLAPDETIFDPPIVATFTYDPALIPSGVPEKNLGIAFYDKAGKLVDLDSTVDLATHTVSAKISHFTVFTVLAYTRPATFTVTNLSVSPAEVDVGKTVTISAVVTNTGDLTGSYQVTLKVNNVVVETKEITLAGRARQTVTFATAQDASGSYTVSVSSLSGVFTVRVPPAPPVPPMSPVPATSPAPPKPPSFTTSALTISPTEVNVREMVTISARVTSTGDLTGSYKVTLKINNVVVETKEVTLAVGASETVTFTTSQDTAGTYSVDVDGLSGKFTVKIPVAPPQPINWWLIGGIYTGVIVIGVIIWLAVRRRRLEY